MVSMNVVTLLFACLMFLVSVEVGLYSFIPFIITISMIGLDISDFVSEKIHKRIMYNRDVIKTKRISVEVNSLCLDCNKYRKTEFSTINDHFCCVCGGYNINFYKSKKRLRLKKRKKYRITIK